MVTSPFLTVTKSMGWVAPKMLYFFRMFPITRSTCILTLAILRVCSTSMPLSCFLPLVNAGILIVEQNNPTDSWMSKPLSAKMTFPGVRWSSRLFSVRCLSLTLPPPHLYQAIWSRVSVVGTVHQPREEMCVTQLSQWFLQTCNPSLSQIS